MLMKIPVSKKISLFKKIFAASVFLIIAFTGCKKNNVLKKSSTTNQYNATSPASKPNIILIVGDDIGYEIPTANGGQSYATPNIDTLAQQGMRFTQCHATPSCSPSRQMLLTGKYNFRNYIAWGIMQQSQKTIANMLKDAGYKTCALGKWQLDGGGQSISTFGFTEHCVWLPFLQYPEELEGSRYKSAKIYQNGAYLPANETNNKYAEDIFTNYLLNFVDSNKAQPFFAYYAMNLCHKAFSPTPDDAAYATWNPDPSVSDKTFQPSMIKYMDKKIGIIVNKVKSLGIQNKTVIIFIGDNGTVREITSRFNNMNVKGAKFQTIEYGTHVPLIVYWPGKVSPGTVNNDLIDFTDFLPTFAGIANIPKPTTYGALDGQSFYLQLTGSKGTPRDWIFTHYQTLLPGSTDSLKRYVQNKKYKLYEGGGFYNIQRDIPEDRPMPDSSLGPKQKAVKQSFEGVLATMHN